MKILVLTNMQWTTLDTFDPIHRSESIRSANQIITEWSYCQSNPSSLYMYQCHATFMWTADFQYSIICRLLWNNRMVIIVGFVYSNFFSIIVLLYQTVLIIRFYIISIISQNYWITYKKKLPFVLLMLTSRWLFWLCCHFCLTLTVCQFCPIYFPFHAVLLLCN